MRICTHTRMIGQCARSRPRSTEMICSPCADGWGGCWHAGQQHADERHEHAWDGNSTKNIGERYGFSRPAREDAIQPRQLGTGVSKPRSTCLCWLTKRLRTQSQLSFDTSDATASSPSPHRTPCRYQPGHTALASIFDMSSVADKPTTGPASAPPLVPGELKKTPLSPIIGSPSKLAPSLEGAKAGDGRVSEDEVRIDLAEVNRRLSDVDGIHRKRRIGSRR